MVLQNYQKFIVLTSNMIYIVALGVGFKCPRKIHLNAQCPPRVLHNPPDPNAYAEEVHRLLTISPQLHFYLDLARKTYYQEYVQ